MYTVLGSRLKEAKRQKEERERERERAKEAVVEDWEEEVRKEEEAEEVGRGSSDEVRAGGIDAQPPPSEELRDGEADGTEKTEQEVRGEDAADPAAGEGDGGHEPEAVAAVAASLEDQVVSGEEAAAEDFRTHVS